MGNYTQFPFRCSKISITSVQNDHYIVGSKFDYNLSHCQTYLERNTLVTLILIDIFINNLIYPITEQIPVMLLAMN